jgi:phosphoglycolate phosphatase-like HAD superfamily hydrolase
MARAELLVCDLDNTLYDWVGYFVPSFYAMVDETVRISGCDREILLNDFRTVHQRAHDSEHPYALLETDCIKQTYKGMSVPQVLRILDPAFHAFNSARKKHLKLYPDVRETLERLSADGIRLVAHTESKLHGVVDRLSRLNLHIYFSRIYCRERSTVPLPEGLEKDDWLKNFPMDRVIELSHHQIKPDREILLEICGREGIEPSRAAYVGDSLAKDVLMAKWADVFSIWAKYGSNHDASTYAALVRVSHWTPADIAREKELQSMTRDLLPDSIADHSFGEVLPILGLSEFRIDTRGQSTLQTQRQSMA